MPSSSGWVTTGADGLSDHSSSPGPASGHCRPEFRRRRWLISWQPYQRHRTVALRVGAPDFACWRETDGIIADRIACLIRRLAAGERLPRGTVTPLGLTYAPLLSVKITPEHRLVYEQRGADLIVPQCRYHY